MAAFKSCDTLSNVNVMYWLKRAEEWASVKNLPNMQNHAKSSLAREISQSTDQLGFFLSSVHSRLSAVSIGDGAASWRLGWPGDAFPFQFALGIGCSVAHTGSWMHWQIGPKEYRHSTIRCWKFIHELSIQVLIIIRWCILYFKKHEKRQKIYMSTDQYY